MIAQGGPLQGLGWLKENHPRSAPVFSFAKPCTIPGKQAGKTQEQVAEAVGLEPGTISRIERGAKGMSIDSLLMFSEIYGVSTDYILKGDKTVASSDALLEELGALVQKYKSL